MSAPEKRENLYLTGFMGCGKSTVARGFHRMYGLPVIEMDRQIEEREGMTIPEIFSRKGEEYFRSLETALLDEMQERRGTVVSCGGGVVLRPENVERMRRNGCIVLLNASPECILKRISSNDRRPLLRGKKTLSGIRGMMEERRSAYEAAASVVIDTDGKSIREICREILLAAGGGLEQLL